nr:hypothetical protein [uncultured Allomuricauda sp.]
MKKREILVTLFMFIGMVSIIAQKEAKCVVTTQSGNEITGYIKRYGIRYDISGGFKLHNGDKKMQLYAKNLSKVVINDTLVYKTLTDRKGRKLLMHAKTEGEPLSLYVLSITRSLSSGQGVSTWLFNEYYFKNEKDEMVYVNTRKLFKNPEDFFPNAPTLHETIKATKRDDINLPIWVKQYNKIVNNTK